MDHLSIRDPRILEALEVCRPGSDDLADPGLRELAEAIEANPEIEGIYERLQAVDKRIAAAFADVPIPEGAQQRLLDRLAAARVASSVPLEGLVPTESEAPAADATVAETAPTGGRRSRRWLFAVGGVASIAASVAVAVLFLGDTEPRYEKAAVLSEAIRFFQDETPEEGQTGARPSKYPLSPALANVQTIQWRWVDGLLQSRGVAYDLRGPRGHAATLYVLPCKVAGLLAGPTRQPHTTGGYSVEAWQEGGLLYVLVVRSGDSRVYEQLLDYRRGPLT